MIKRMSNKSRNVIFSEKEKPLWDATDIAKGPYKLGNTNANDLNDLNDLNHINYLNQRTYIGFRFEQIKLP
jgi:hypothetical protein